MSHTQTYFFLGFMTLLTAIFIGLGMSGDFFSSPHGLHFMRQTDSLSFAYQYYNHGFDFFNPKLYNLKNVEGRAACEFPITYYLASFMFVFFGKQAFLLKLIHLIIQYLGVFYVFRFSKLLIQNTVVALIISLFFFTSTVFNYYSFNYLPDTPALGLCFIGLYYLFRYNQQNTKRDLILLSIFLTLSGLIKVTFALYIVTIVLFALSVLFSKRDNLLPKIQSQKLVLFGTGSLLLIFLWNLYITQYNTNYNSHSFINSPLPIWQMTRAEIAETWSIMIHYWDSEYFSHLSMAALVLLVLIQIVFFKKGDKKIKALSLISLLGCLCYFFLFYSQFKDHDYYVLVFFPLLALVILNGAKVSLEILSAYKPLFLNIVLVIFTLVVAYGIRYSRFQLAHRYSMPPDSMSTTSVLLADKIEAIKKLNLPKDAKFIVAPDPSQNGTLLFLDREGWNLENMDQLTLDTLAALHEKGADYLLVKDLKKESNTGDLGRLLFDEEGLQLFALPSKIEP